MHYSLITRKSSPLPLPAITGMMLVTSLMTAPVRAGVSEPAPMMESAAPAVWMWGVSADYMYRNVDRSEDYLSAPFDWHVDYSDFDGDLWGFAAFATFPSLWNITFDFAYRTGDLDGRFTNYSLDRQDPDFGNIYTGTASFDRDEYVFGLTWPCPTIEWLFARVEWFRFEEDGDWIYGGGFVESQEYRLWGLSAGLGARHGMPLGDTGATLELSAYAGLVYFDFEHKEVASGAQTEWEDWGFHARIGARVSYPIHDRLAVFLGTGYEYLVTDDGSLDMTNDGVFVNLGLRGEF